MHNSVKFLLVLLSAFGGGFFAQYALKPSISMAAAPLPASAPMFLFGDDGQVRLQVGTYTAPGERGLPMIGMSDNHGHLRMLFRLAGANESPVIVMKDRAGRDRLVMGLGLSDSGEDAFLSITDSNGKKQNLFGAF